MPRSFIIMLISLTLLPLMACRSGEFPNQSEDTTSQPAVVQPLPAHPITFTSDDVHLSVNQLANWESFTTDHGIVTGERFGSVATAGVLEGLMLYIYVTPLPAVTLSAQRDANLAQTTLNALLNTPHMAAHMAFTRPNSFEWDGYPAAYYLMSSVDETATLVIGIAIPEHDLLLSCSISAPYAQRNRIRALLPALLNGLTMNEVVFTGDALQTLPATLPFPQRAAVP
ncbi:MAG: hypothetical protein H7Y11_03360 [Armatimonadetes bacterium]|nr:hypothetical protein [Anaerolineae bacterium]